MDIPLHPVLQEFVDEQVRAGHYESPEAMINAAVARLKSDHELSADELLELRDEIAIATKEADQGDVDNWDAADLKRRVREHLKQKNRMG